ncbi:MULTISPECIES: O-antigen ligase family protein [unclassified Nocardioides]|uniref:O-antigen ligase family protein n=1 Tax=unclassified Nocardioides TaxID=2615069 RepID=UPI0012E3D211|nr:MULTISPECIES: O-antigen ligase family protein [unclassified Nocardioides]
MTTARSTRPASSSDAPGATERRLVALTLCLVTIGLTAAATRGLLFALIALGAAVFLVVLGVIGRERTAMLTMMAAFATAPMYKGLAPSPSSAITPTDLLFGLSVMLLLPSLLRHKVNLPLGYVLGVSLILITGTLSTAFSPDPLVSALQFVQWLVVLVGLVTLVAIWAPKWKAVDLLVWSYVVGQMASVAYSPLDGGIADRRIGLSHHPNAFGEAGVMTFALAMYLWRRHDAVWYRVLVAGAAGAGAVSAVTSGSRAATVVIAGLVLMVPIVERSAIRGFLLAIGGAVFVFSLPLLVDSTGDTSALSRLAGSADSLVADRARLDAQDLGISLFLQHPIAGNGFADAIYVHNVVLGVLASVGVIGFLGYLMVLFVLARPLFGHHPNRRLGYVVWAFIAITPTVPGLEDRTLWVPMSLTILLAIQSRLGSTSPDTTTTESS